MDSKIIIFEEFARKAAQRLEERKKRNTEILHIGSLDQNIEIRGLSDKEFADCTEFSSDPIEVDKYTIYYASKTLQETAKIMVANGSLPSAKEYMICDIFSPVERGSIVKRIIHLSGLDGEADIQVISEVDEIKNSLSSHE